MSLPPSKFRYAYVRIQARGQGATKFDAYREEIDRRAEAGWRFVAAVTPPEMMTTSGAAYVDLVFETQGAIGEEGGGLQP